MKIYKCEERDFTESELDELALIIMENIEEDIFDEFLNEIYGEIEVCGYEYNSANLLKEIDSIAYRCGFSDYKNGCEDDIVNELNCMCESEEIYGTWVDFEEIDFDCEICGETYDTKEEALECCAE